MDTQVIKVQVRDNGDYREGFFHENGELCCFSFVDGHCFGVSHDYRLRKCRAVNTEEAHGFVNAMQRHYDQLPGGRVKLVMVQRM